MVEQEIIANTPPAARPLQFTLRRLFAAFAFLSVLLASYSWLGIVGPFVVLFFSSIAVAVLKRQPGWAFLGLLSVVAVAVLFAPAPRGPFPRVDCTNRLMQIGKALQLYHAHHGSFPPAFVGDESGRPAHSWRVLILSELDRHLYSNYDFSEPWNGSHNVTIVGPRYLRCPSDRSTADTTNYLAVTGPGTAWPGAKGSKLSDFADPSKTILVVEVANCDVHWSEPRDLVVADIEPVINSKITTGISSRHKGGANVLFADGHVEFLPVDKLPAELQALLTPPPLE